MTMRSRSTLKMFTVRSGIARQEIPEEAVKLLALYEDPTVSPEQKLIVKAQLEDMIRKLEERVTSRRLKQAQEKK